MKVNKKISAVFFMAISAVLISCKQSSEQDCGSKILYMGNVKSVIDTTLMKNSRIFTFEDTPHSLFSKIERVLKNEGTYYLMDKVMKQILLYDTLGYHISTIHRVGGGAGEYANIRDISVDRYKKQLLVLADPSSILFYNLDGRYEATLRLEKSYNSIGVDKDYIYLSQSTFVNNKPEKSSIAIVEKQSHKIIEKLQPLFETAPYCYTQGMSISLAQQLYFTRRFDDTIYHLNGTEVTPFYTIDWQKHSFPKETKKQTLKCKELNKLCSENEYIYSLTDIQETDNALYFRTNLPGLNVLSKQQGEIKNYSMITNSTFDIPLPNYLPVGGSDGEILFIYPAHLIPVLTQQIANKEIPSELKALLQSMTEDSNPLVFKYILK